MNIQIIQIPYDSGRKAARTGKGPGQFLEYGVDTRLTNLGHHVEIATVESDISFPTEIGTTFDINRTLAAQVRSAVGDNRFPLVLAGNCNSCVGVISGLSTKQLGIVWFDAHGDFNTPETSTTGFLDGMGLAMAAGRCWKPLANSVPGFKPVTEDCIIHVGARDVDPLEGKMLEESDIFLLSAGSAGDNRILTEIDQALATLTNRIDGIYLHIDMDVLETKQGRPNHLAVPGGLSLQTVIEAIEAVKNRFPVAGCTVSAYDPAYDEDNCVLEAGIEVICSVVQTKRENEGA